MMNHLSRRAVHASLQLMPCHFDHRDPVLDIAGGERERIEDFTSTIHSRVGGQLGLGIATDSQARPSRAV